MSYPHNFSDDPNQFTGPPDKNSNATTILIVIAVVCGGLMLICGGVIVGGVMMVRQASQQFEVVMEDAMAEAMQSQAEMQEFTAFTQQGQYREALQSIDEALIVFPDDANLHNNKAWLLATCPEDEIRDGTTAIEHAQKACDLTGRSNAAFIDTLAASHAEAGEFEAAVKHQQSAIDMDPAGMFGPGLKERLELYKSGQPYREDPRTQSAVFPEGAAFPGGVVMPEGREALSDNYVDSILEDSSSGEESKEDATDQRGDDSDLDDLFE
jgi:tetratricopeptide (TPR) repeat protein